MKIRRLIALIIAALCVCTAHICAFAAEDEVVAKKSDHAVVLRSLLAFSKVKSYKLDGEMTVTANSSTMGETATDTQTSKLTGGLADGKLTLATDSFELAADSFDFIDAQSLGELLTKIDRSMLDNYEVINEFDKDGVRYIDISVIDLSEFNNYGKELQKGLTEAITDVADDEIAALFAEVLAPMLSSAKITGYEYFRIDTKKAQIIGVGIEISMSSDFNLFDMPISLQSKGTGFINIIY